MKVADLMEVWEKTASGDLTVVEYPVHLPIEDAAKIEALADMFPRRNREQLLTDLLSAALDELVASFPYIPGETIIARDEEGDPMYEDIGQTPQYLRLIEQHLTDLKRSSGH